MVAIGLFVILLAGSTLGSSENRSGQKLLAAFQGKEPFSLPANKQIKIQHFQTRLDGLNGDGVSLEVVDRFSSAEWTKEYFRNLADEYPAISDQRFIDRVENLFSKPFVTRAMMMCVRDWSNKIVKEIFDNPDWAEAVLPGEPKGRVVIEYSTRSRDGSGFFTSLRFIKDEVATIKIDAGLLKDALSHLTGVIYPEWTAAQVANKLGGDPRDEFFVLGVPKSQEEADQLSKDHLELMRSDYRKIIEEYDAERQLFVDFSTSSDGYGYASIINSLKQNVTFTFPEPTVSGAQPLRFFIDKTKGTGIRLSPQKISDILFRLTGVPIPLFAAQRIVEKISRRPESFSEVEIISADLDMYIWRHLAQKSKRLEIL